MSKPQALGTTRLSDEIEITGPAYSATYDRISDMTWDGSQYWILSDMRLIKMAADLKVADRFVKQFKVKGTSARIANTQDGFFVVWQEAIEDQGIQSLGAILGARFNASGDMLRSSLSRLFASAAAERFSILRPSPSCPIGPTT